MAATVERGVCFRRALQQTIPVGNLGRIWSGFRLWLHDQSRPGRYVWANAGGIRREMLAQIRQTDNSRTAPSVAGAPAAGSQNPKTTLTSD